MKLDPKITVVRFESEDVIAASSRTVVLSNFEDSEGGNNTFSFGGNNYVITDTPSYHAFRADLSNYVGDSDLASKTAAEIFFDDGSKNRNINDLYRLPNRPSVNGTYVYNGTGTYSFSKKQ